MTPTSEVIRLAQAAGFFLNTQPVDQYTVKGYLANVERLISLAKAEEREACAKLCDAAKDSIWPYHEQVVIDTSTNVCTNLAKYIRGRTQEAP